MNHPSFLSKGLKTLLLDKFKLYYPSFLYIKVLDVFFYADPKSGIWKIDFNNLTLNMTIKIEYPKRICDEFQYIVGHEENKLIKDIFSLKDEVDTLLKLLKKSKFVATFINELKTQIFVNDLSHFNQDPNLILFKNDVVFDLKSKKTVKVHWTDMIANNQQLNVSFEPENNEKIALLIDIFNEIIVNNESKENFLKYLFQSLSGFKSKRFMLNFGGNYKRIIMDVWVNILGTYGAQVPDEGTKFSRISEFLQQIDLNAFEQLRTIVINVENKKEFDVWSFRSRLTCGHYTSRRLYEEPTNNTTIRASYFINCDQITFTKPEYEFVDHAMEARMLKTEFRTYADVEFEILFNDKFIKEYGMQFIHYLFKFCD